MSELTPERLAKIRERYANRGPLDIMRSAMHNDATSLLDEVDSLRAEYYKMTARAMAAERQLDDLNKRIDALEEYFRNHRDKSVLTDDVSLRITWHLINDNPVPVRKRTFSELVTDGSISYIDGAHATGPVVSKEEESAIRPSTLTYKAYCISGIKCRHPQEHPNE